MKNQFKYLAAAFLTFIFTIHEICKLKGFSSLYEVFHNEQFERFVVNPKHQGFIWLLTSVDYDVLCNTVRWFRVKLFWIFCYYAFQDIKQAIKDGEIW